MLKFEIALLKFLKLHINGIDAADFVTKYYKGNEKLKWGIQHVILHLFEAKCIQCKGNDKSYILSFFGIKNSNTGLELRITSPGEERLKELEGWKILTKQNLVMAIVAIIMLFLGAVVQKYSPFLPDPNTIKEMFQPDTTKK